MFVALGIQHALCIVCLLYVLFVLLYVLFVLLYVLFVCCMYCLFCSMYCLFRIVYVLFVCKCVLYFCHRVTTQLQLTNISYRIKCACAMLSSVACPALQNFSTFSHKQYDFRKNKVIEREMFVCAVQFLSETFLILRRNVWDKINVYWSSCKVPFPSSRVQTRPMPSDFSGRKNPQHAFLRRGSKAVRPMS